MPINRTLKDHIQLSSILETIEDWFASQSLEVFKLRIEKSEEGALTFAKGEFHPVLFDKEMDGPKIAILYQLELAYVDNRFENTKLIFDTDTTFRIV